MASQPRGEEPHHDRERRSSGPARSCSRRASARRGCTSTPSARASRTSSTRSSPASARRAPTPGRRRSPSSTSGPSSACRAHAGYDEGRPLGTSLVTRCAGRPRRDRHRRPGRRRQEHGRPGARRPPRRSSTSTPARCTARDVRGAAPRRRRATTSTRSPRWRRPSSSSIERRRRASSTASTRPREIRGREVTEAVSADRRQPRGPRRCSSRGSGSGSPSTAAA